MSGDGRTVLVTGASTGIGATTALHLDGAGWTVYAGVRREQDGERLRERADSRFTPVIVDVSDAASIAALVGRLGDARLDGLVNNAGIVVAGPLEFVPLDELRRQLEVNVIGHVAVTQALLPALRRARGRIVFTGSIGGRIGQPFLGPYCASKHALEAVADALRMELRPWGIGVSIVEPGAVRTPLWQKSTESNLGMIGAMPEAAIRLYGKAIERMPKVAALQEKGAVRPERVARVVERALTAARPRPRYLVGPDARAMLAVRRTIGDRAFDRLVLTATGLPRKNGAA